MKFSKQYENEKKNKGSFTVELTIVFTMVLFILFAFIFGIMLLYQHVFLQKAVNSAVLHATEVQGYTGTIDEEQSDISNEIRNQIEKEMQASMFGAKELNAVFNSETGEAGVVKVTLEQEVSIPLGVIKQFFTGKDTLTISASTTFIDENTVQSIRNVDFVIEAVSRTTSGVKEEIGAITDSIISDEE